MTYLEKYSILKLPSTWWRSTGRAWRRAWRRTRRTRRTRRRPGRAWRI